MTTPRLRMVISRLRSGAWRTVGIAAATVVLATLATLAVMAITDSGPDTPEVRGPTARLVLDGPAEIEAGESWTIEVAGIEEPAAQVIVDVWGSWGVRRIESSIAGGSGSIEVPGGLVQQSGRISAVVSTAGAEGRIGVDVVPGPAVDGIVPLAGPRSMIADSAHWTMVTAIPRDRFGNSVADGTPVTLHVRRPDGTLDMIETEVADLLSGVRVFSGTQAGRSTVRVSVDGSTGPEVDVLEVPGPPAVVELLEPDLELRADGRMLVTITTGVLADRFGNVLLDGTAASIDMSGPTGVGTLTAVTIDGRAEFVIEAPTSAGTIELRGVVDDVAGAPLELTFAPAAVAVPARVVRADGSADSPVIVEIGPVLTELGGFVPDGTTAVVAAASSSGGTGPATVALRDGVGSVAFDAVSGDVLTVEVLGTRIELVAP